MEVRKVHSDCQGKECILLMEQNMKITAVFKKKDIIDCSEEYGDWCSSYDMWEQECQEEGEIIPLQENRCESNAGLQDYCRICS